MRMSRFAILAAAPLMALPQAQAQDYPNKTITIIVPFSAGGPTDTVARLVAQSMTTDLGQQIIVDNKAYSIKQPLFPDGLKLKDSPADAGQGG